MDFRDDFAPQVQNMREQSRELEEQIRKRVARLTQLGLSLEAGRRSIENNVEYLTVVRSRGMDDTDALFQLESSLSVLNRRMEEVERVLLEQKPGVYPSLEQLVGLRITRSLQAWQYTTVEQIAEQEWDILSNVRNIGPESMRVIHRALIDNRIQPHESWHGKPS